MPVTTVTSFSGDILTGPAAPALPDSFKNKWSVRPDYAGKRPYVILDLGNLVISNKCARKIIFEN